MGHPLKTFREQHTPKLSHGALADLLDVDRSTVWRWEANKQKIDKELLPRVAERTGIAPAELRPDLADLLRGSEC